MSGERFSSSWEGGGNGVYSAGCLFFSSILNQVAGLFSQLLRGDGSRNQVIPTPRLGGVDRVGLRFKTEVFGICNL